MGVRLLRSAARYGPALREESVDHDTIGAFRLA